MFELVIFWSIDLPCLELFRRVTFCLLEMQANTNQYNQYRATIGVFNNHNFMTSKKYYYYFETSNMKKKKF